MKDLSFKRKHGVVWMGTQRFSGVLDAGEFFDDRPHRLASVIKARSSQSNRAYYRRLGASFFSLPQVVLLLDVGDTANPSGLMSGW